MLGSDVGEAFDLRGEKAGENEKGEAEAPPF